jgi:hypothetical protein
MLRLLYICIAILVAGCGSSTLSRRPATEDLPGLKSPANSNLKQLDEIKKIGLEWWFQNRGLMAEESARIAGCFSVVRPIKNFAARDDVVWEVRIVHFLGGSLTGILWINERTQQVIALGIEPK